MANVNATKTKVQDLAGERFDLLVVEFFIERKDGRTWWSCKCDCGGRRITTTSSLKSGGCRSCGCLHQKTAQNQARKLFTTHGLSKTPEYVVWCAMLARCYNKNRDKYRYYGGQGIQVCEKWRESFPAFLQDMGQRPSPKHSIERRDGTKNYEPENCFWATAFEQAKNRRNARLYPYNGEMLMAPEIS